MSFLDRLGIPKPHPRSRLGGGDVAVPTYMHREADVRAVHASGVRSVHTGRRSSDQEGIGLHKLQRRERVT